MTFGTSPFAESSFAGTVLGAPAPAVPGGGEGPPPVIVIDPFSIEISGVKFSGRDNTLRMEGQLGRQGTASFELTNVYSVPRIGEPIRVLFYQQVIFAGSIDRVNVMSEPSHSVTVLNCECIDHSYLLVRRKVRRTFSNVTLSAIASALIADELIGDGITLGVVEISTKIPVIEADKVSAFDLLNDAAVSVGALFYIDNDKRLNFRSASIEPAPMAIDEAIVETCDITFDRETFRNRQTVIVTGTPPAGTDAEPNVITYTATSGTEAPQQAVIEGTSGIYNNIESITHPISNFTIDLTKLGVAYARILLAVQGVLRETLKVRTRQFGFRVGQTAPVSLPHLARTGSYIIQKLSMREVDGRYLVTTMELSPSTLRRRAQQLWLDVVRKGSTVILPPTAITTNTQTFATLGTYTFTVPPGITLVQVTCKGGGGGGGGGAFHSLLFAGARFQTGGPGGRGGLAISVLDVTPGEVLNITVPSGGAGGASQSKVNVVGPAIGANGGNGGTAIVARSGGQVCTAYGGWAGIGAQVNVATGLSSGAYPQSPDGSGLGQVVTAGAGGHQGGAGNGSPLTNGLPGGNGSVIVEW